MGGWRTGVGKRWTGAEKEMDRSLLKDGKLVDRHWERDGQELRRRWTGPGKEVERS
jgi:hypothetical protein